VAAAALVAAGLVCIGPWPHWPEHYEGADYAEATFARIERLNLSPPPGPLTAGVAVVEITPSPGEPLAGFSARDPKQSEGVLDRLYVKAISLSTGERTFTIVGADILLILPDLREAVLERTRLPADEVYFTATHTHSGPGGYSPRWLDQISLGAFDRRILDRLADAFADAIRQSRSHMVDASLAWGASPGDPNQPAVANRLDPIGNAHATVFTMALRARASDSAPTTPLAIFASASAHPTCLRAANHQASADYPGVVQQVVEKRSAFACLFAAAAPGSMAAAEETLDPLNRRQTVGRRLADVVCEIAGPSAHWADQTVLAGGLVRVGLPAVQYRLGDAWRLSPVAASFLHGRTTFVQALRVGNVVFLGMPCDYSGELAIELENWARSRGVLPAITSFNGDYIGYLLPRARYDESSYEARGMGFFGPWAGEYFQDISRRIIDRIVPATPAVPKAAQE